MKALSLRELRLKTGLTQTQVGKAIGIHQVVLSRYENGAVMPSAVMLQTLADFYGVSASGVKILESPTSSRVAPIARNKKRRLQAAL